MNPRRLFLTTLFIVFCLSAAFFPRQRLQSASDSPLNQTVPTRTPTSSPVTPTQPPGGGDPPGNTATPTTLPQVTAVSPPVTLAATPEGGFLATAVPCGGQPTVRALNTTFVRSGPGTNYEAVGTLVYLEVRPIVGRAGDAAWWLVELESGQRAWVADTVVDVQGYTAIVPIAVSPPIGGNTPTPGATWNPTPLPTCTVTPTATVTTSPTPTETIGATATATAVPTTSPTATLAPPTPTATEDSQAIAAVDSDTITPQPTAAPLEVDAANGTSYWLPVTAVVLLAAGVVIMLARRRDSEL